MSSGVGKLGKPSKLARPATATQKEARNESSPLARRPPRPSTAKQITADQTKTKFSKNSIGLSDTRPMTAKIDRLGATTSYMSGANLWGGRKKERVRPATAKASSRKVIKVRNTAHLRSIKPNYKGLTSSRLHAARDGYIYPSSRPASNTSQSLYRNNTDASKYLDEYAYDRNSIYAFGGLRRRRERPASSASYRSNASYRSRPGSSSSYQPTSARRNRINNRPHSGYQSSFRGDAMSEYDDFPMGDEYHEMSVGDEEYDVGVEIVEETEQEQRSRLRYPPWRQPLSTDAFARQSAEMKRQLGSHSQSSTCKPLERNESNIILSNGSSSLASLRRPTTAGSSTSAATSWSRPSSRGDYIVGTRVAGNVEDYDPALTWQIRESHAIERGYGQLGIAPSRRGKRPSSAASTHSRVSVSTELRPTSPESLVPHPRGGKLRSRQKFKSNFASDEQPNSDTMEPWDVHLSSTIPRPRNALSVVAPPTAPQRRPTTALDKRSTVPHSRPWSTDPSIRARTQASKSPAVIHLSDGRPHTVGVTRDSVPYDKVVTYKEAFDLTGSHLEARRMMDTQHRMIKESRVRDYENWQFDKTALHVQKVASRRWGTTGAVSMENPVTRAIARQMQRRHQKVSDPAKSRHTSISTSTSKNASRTVKHSGDEKRDLLNRQNFMQYMEDNGQEDLIYRKKNEQQSTPSLIPTLNKDRTPKPRMVLNQDNKESKTVASQVQSNTPSQKHSISVSSIDEGGTINVKNYQAFHKAMMNSYGTGEIEVLWLGLTEIPRSVMMSTLALQCQHLSRFSVGGNLITKVPSWLFPNLHALRDLNLSNNKLVEIPESINLLEHLTRFKCCYNKLIALPDTIVHLENLTELDCTGNSISSLPRRLGSLTLLRIFRIGDNNLQFLSGGVENLVSLHELVLTRNRLGTLAMITPLNVRKANPDDVWEKSRLPISQGGDTIYFNRRTTETLRRPPEGAVIVAAQGYESEDEEESTKIIAPSNDHDLQKQAKLKAWKEKLSKRAHRLKLRDELAKQGKGIWEVKWTMFTGRAYYFNHFEKRRSDTMPRELDRIGMLPAIRRLTVSFNVLQELPSSIGRLETLEELVLDHNKLVELPKSICGLVNLKFLSFTDNRLEALPPQLKSLDKLRTINGTYNHISDIPKEIGHLTGLEKLWLSNNKIEKLPSEMYRMESLVEIFLSDNPLMVPLPAIIEKGVSHFLRDCKERWLRDNKLGQPPGVTVVATGVRGEIIVPEPRYRKAIKDILIRAEESNTLEMQWKELSAVPSDVWKLSKLRELRLQNNLLTSSAFSISQKESAWGLHKFSNLMLLSLSNNQLHEFPSVLLKCTSIEVLDLSNNFIPALPKKIHRMYRLRSLNLSQNRLTHLPKKIGSLVELTYLNLDINHIGPSLPTSFCALHKLKTLKLVQNRLQTLPISGMGQLTSLTLLNLNSNRVGPTLPDDISFMPVLKELYLSHNRIKTLSPEFCHNELATSLRTLWLYGNRIIQLPHAFRYLTSLCDVRLENNPMRSPPPELALQGPERVLRYCSDRLVRIEEFKRIMREEHIRFNQNSLIPRSENVFTEGTDYLTPEDLEEFDHTIDRTLNGPYYNFDIDVPGLVDFMRARKLERRIAHHKQLLEQFLIFVETALSAKKMDARYFREDMHRPWGENGKDEEVYSLTLEPLYMLREGFQLPSIQREIDLETAERRARAEDTPPPTPGREVPKHSIMDVTNDIFKTKGKPTFDYPLWQVREAVSEWVGPFGRVAQIEHGIRFQDLEAYEKFSLLLEVLEEKIQRQSSGAEKARKRIARTSRAAEEAARNIADAEAAIASAEGREEEGSATPLDASAGTKVNVSLVISNENINGELSPDQQIIQAFDNMVAEAKVLREKMHSCKAATVDNVVVIVKAIFTLEEVRRQHEEEKDLELAEDDARKEVQEWLETKFGKKALTGRLKAVRKFHKGQLKEVRKDIKKILGMKPKMEKDLAAMMKRKKAFDKGKKIEFHRFETLAEAEEAVAMVQQPLDDALSKVEKLRMLEQSRLELTKQPKELLLRQAEIDLADKYALKARRHARDEARVDARKSGLRRPWDGPNGRAFRMWCEEQDNLLDMMLDPPSDTPLSSSSTDISTDTEPEVDTQTAAGIAKRKAWEAKHKLKLEANKYKWSRILTDSQKERKAKKAEEAKKLLYKFGENESNQTEEEKEIEDEEAAADGDDERSVNGDDERSVNGDDEYLDEVDDGSDGSTDET